MVLVSVKKAPGIVVPEYKHLGDSGADIFASEQVEIPSGKTRLVHTGLFISIPYGYEGQVRSRSGLALKAELFVTNSPGTIDSNYRGEVGVILTNLSEELVIITPGMRVAQLVIAPVINVEFTLVEELDDTHRGENGFGSTGIC